MRLAYWRRLLGRIPLGDGSKNINSCVWCANVFIFLWVFYLNDNWSLSLWLSLYVYVVCVSGPDRCVSRVWSWGVVARSDVLCVQYWRATNLQAMTDHNPAMGLLSWPFQVIFILLYVESIYYAYYSWIKLFINQGGRQFIKISNKTLQGRCKKVCHTMALIWWMDQSNTTFTHVMWCHQLAHAVYKIEPMYH